LKTQNSASSEEELVADACGLPQLRGGSPHADTPEGFLQFHLQLSREVCLLAERLENLEHRVHSSSVGSYVEAQLGEVVDAGRRDAEQRRELAATFASALQEEREARISDMSELRASLADMSQAAEASLARVGAAEVKRVSEAAGAEWAAFAESVRGLGERMLEDLSEQHAQAALDLADRHREAA